MSFSITNTSGLVRLLPPSSGADATATLVDPGTSQFFDAASWVVSTPDSRLVSVVRGVDPAFGPDGVTFDGAGRMTSGKVYSIEVVELPEGAPPEAAYAGVLGKSLVTARPPSSLSGDAIQALVDAAAQSGDPQPLIEAIAPLGQFWISAPSAIGESYDMRQEVDLALLGENPTITAYGFSGDDTLIGGDGADRLFSYDGVAGYAGRDVLIGGDGGDTYTVFLGATRGRTGPDGLPLPEPSVEIVEESDGTGRDVVTWTGPRFDLRGTNIEDLILRDLRNAVSSDRTPVEGIGSEEANLLNGAVRQRYRSENGERSPDGDLITLTLSGLGGDDTIFGSGDGQVLSGGEGDDRIVARVLSPFEGDAGRGNAVRVDGDAGDDLLILQRSEGFDPPAGPELYELNGGDGNDLFSLRTADGIAADVDGGTGRDELRLSDRGSEGLTVSDVEVIRAVGRQDVVLTANAGVEVLRGDRGDDTLDTGDVEDLVLLGGAGDDTFVLRAEGAVIREGAGLGTDRVESFGIDVRLRAHVEDAALVGEASEARLIGNGLDNALTGDDGANILFGAGGVDTLTGGAGADVFAFVPRRGDGDIVADFVSGEDRVALLRLDLGEVALADALVLGAEATEAEHRLIFDAGTGAFSYDADGAGDGAAQLIATFEGGATLAAGDIVLV